MKLIAVLSSVLLFCAISVQSENLEASPGEINKFEEAPENDEEVDISNWFELQHETIEQQADQPTSGEQFIAIRIGAAGSKDQINPDLAGLVRIATQFLPNSYTFINVVSASREVVAGIKYELLVNALDENKSEVQCEIRILEQPWIITNKNEKLRTLMYSNCSKEEPSSNERKGDETQHSINPIFNNEETVMTDDRLKDMVALIIPTVNTTPKPPPEVLSERPETSNSHPKEDEDVLTVITLSKGTSSFLDDFFSFGKTENKPIPARIENEVIPKFEAPTRIEPAIDRGESENTFYHVAPKSNGELPIASNTETSTQAAAVEVNNIEQKINGEVSQVMCTHIQTNENLAISDPTFTSSSQNIDSTNVNVERKKRSSIDDNEPMLMENILYNKLLKSALARLDRYDEDNNKRILLSVRKANVDKNVYKFDVTIADTKCSEFASNAENCKPRIIDDSIKLCRFEIEHLDNDDIKLRRSDCAPVIRKSRQVGGARPVSESERQQVEGFLKAALEKGDGPGLSTLEEIIEITKQTVSGKLYKVKAKFNVEKSTQVCNVEIWDRPWLGESARQITFDCGASERRKRQIVGGISTVPNSEVEPLLNEVLLEGAYQTYRLVRIIETTHQLVAGSLYRIKAEFAVEQSTKNCNVTIWDRPWLDKAAREVEFNCDVNDDVARTKRNSPKQRTIKGGITPLPDSEKSKVESLLNEVLVEGDYQSYRLVRVIEASRQVVAGLLYRIKAKFEVDGNQQICNVKVWVKVAGEGKEITEFNCEESNERSKRQILGGITPTSTSDKAEVESLLNEVLSGGDYQSYRLIRIIESSHQIVTGFLYRIKAEFSVNQLTKVCDVTILDRPWLGKSARQVEFNCDGILSEKRQIVGGISPTSKSDKLKIKELLNEVLAEGDYQSYRLVRIIESTIQIVSGTIYKIKAEFSIDQSLKICNIQILDRPWLGKSGREVEFNCGESSSHKRHIHGGFKSIHVREKEVDNDFLKYTENILKDIIRSCDYQSYKLIRVIDSTSEVIAGFLYQIKAEFSVNGFSEVCNIKIWEKEANQGREVQEFICYDQNLQNVEGNSLSAAGQQSNNEYVLDDVSTGRDIGGSSDQEKIQLESLLNSALTNTVYKFYKLVRIIEFTKQKVEGFLYRIDAEFIVNGVEQSCDVELWHKTSNQENSIQEFNCIQKFPVQHDFNPTSEKDQPKVEKILKEILAYEDYQSYKLVKILQSWQQVTVGINYKIMVEFKVKGQPKICDIKILNMFTKNGKRVVQSVCQSIAEHVSGEINSISTTDTVYITSLVNGILLQGNYQSYKLVRIIEFTKQIAAGVLYRIKAQFEVESLQKICNLKIWDKISNQGREVQEFICEEPTTPVRGGVTATSADEKSTIGNILNGILASGDYQSYRLVRIIESTKQIVAGILYRIKAEFLVDGVHKICNVKIWDKVSNQGREVQEFNCESPTTSSLGGSNAAGLSTIVEKHSKPLAGGVIATSEDDKSAVLVTGGSHTGGITTSQEHVRPVLGGVTATSENDQSVIENILNGILASGDYKSYRLVRIIESTKQIVAGILYRIKAEFLVDGTHKICNVKIWDKVSNQGREVQEFICESHTTSALGGSNAAGLSTIIEKHSKPLAGGVIATSEEDKSVILVTGGSHAGGVTTSQDHSRPVLGGVTATSENDQFAIENILNGILASGDYQSYRLVRIIESTKQIVAGILYRIKAEFLVDGIHKICNVKIWDKVSNQGREVQEFICESHTTSALGSSNAAGLSTIIEKHSKPLAGGIIATSEGDKSAVLVTGGSHAGGITTSQEHVRPVLGGVTATSENDQSAIENILNGILASGDYKSYRLVRIIESTKQIVAGILYRVKAEFLVDGTHKICNVKIWDKVSNQGREVQEFICESPTTSSLGGSNAAGLSTIVEKHSKPLAGGVIATSEDDKSAVLVTGGSHAGGITTSQEHVRPVLGGVTATSENDQSAIENILNGILASGDYKSYRLVRIIESTKQIVAGILYRVKAEFLVDGTHKICNVKIWDKVSNQGREVQEFICESPTISSLGGSNAAGLSTIIEKHSKPLAGGVTATLEDDKSAVLVTRGSHAGGITTSQEYVRPVLGGVTATSENDHSLIENILNGILATGDYQSYRLVRIIESTKQIVAGILYRIKAEFLVDGVHKICNVKIWDKVSNQGREVQEFNCESPTTSSLGGSNAAGLSTIIEKHSKPLAGGVIATSEDDKSAVLVTGGSHTGGITTSQEHVRPVLGGVTATSENDQSVIENILNGILASGDYKSYRLVRIIESTKQIVAGILYRIKAEFLVDGTHKICNVKIWDKVSNQGREVQEFICESPTTSSLGGSNAAGLSTIVEKHSKPLAGGVIATSEDDKSAVLVTGGSHTGGITTSQEHVRPVLGGVTATSENDQSVIENILNGILASGDYKSYRLVRIIESTKQIVAGILYRIKAEFLVDGTHKICNVKIWDKVSNQGREVQEFICESPTTSALGGSNAAGLSTIIEKHSKPLAGGVIATSEEDKSVILVTGGSHAGGVTTSQDHSRPVLGGVTATSENDQFAIENILNGILASGDYQSYRLVRIIESTKQIVAGILYRIKAEFLVDGIHKICNVKIWDKVSNQGREVQEFICESPTTSALGGSNAAGLSTIIEKHSKPLAGGVIATSEDDKSAVLVTGGSHAGGITTSQEHVRPVLGGVTATSENDQSVIENILNGILASGDYKSYRLVRIIESTKQIVAGILYRIKAEFLVDGTHKICNVKIWDKVSNQGREVQEFICESPTTSSLGGSNAAGLSTIVEKHSKPLAGGVVATSEDDKSAVLVTGGSHTGGITTSQEHVRPVLGGVTATSENDQSVIENILNGILASGDYKSYRLVRIIESTKQIVAGILYRIKAEFLVDGTHKICNVKIWDKVSNQGREVQEFICESHTTSALGGSNAAGLSTIIEKHSKPLAGGVIATSEEDKSVILVTGGSHAGGVTTSQDHSRPVLGGVTATSENDQFAIENILNGILASGDYQSYRLVRIIESTKQIVAGILYRIKAEFLVDGIHKICNVKIWDKVSNQGREVQEFICESHTTSALGSSNAAGLSTIIEKHSKPLAGGIIATSEDDKSAVLVTGGSHAGGITTSQEHVRPVLGGVTATSENDQSAIENILNGILASGDYKSYRLVRIIESTKQIVAGILYRVKAEFLVDGTHKICNVKIWDKVSNQGREVQEFICESPTTSSLGGTNAAGLSTIVEKHSKPLAGGVIATSEDDKSAVLVTGGSHAGGITTSQEHVRPVLGGVTATSENDQSAIENIVNGILASGDYKSYRLVRIIESTKQIVAGILYRVKAEFLVDGTHKICNVKIWDKVSNQGREVQEFICESPTTSSLGGSNAAGLSTIVEKHSKPLAGGVIATSEDDKSAVLVTGGSHTGGITTSQEHVRPVLGGVTATSENDQSVIENILNGILASGDYQSYRLVRIIESTKQIVAGILYRIKAEFLVDGTHKICNVKIWDKVSNQGREVQEFICESPTTSALGGSNAAGLSTIIEKHSKPLAGGVIATSEDDKSAVLVTGGSHAGGITTSQEHVRPVLGGVTATSENDQSVIENILNGILASGDYKSYRLVRIIESTKQIVAGILYRIKAEFLVDGTHKICNVKIWDKVSNQGREVQEFICESPNSSALGGSNAAGLSTIIEKHSKPLAGGVIATSEDDKSAVLVTGGSHAGGITTSQEHVRPVLGGVTATSENDQFVIENILNGILASGDYQSYRLVRIIESTKQIVAGILYRIKAEFLVDGTHKICNVKIWDKVSNQGREIQEFICESPNSSALGGSNAAGLSTIIEKHSKPLAGGVIATSEDDKSAVLVTGDSHAGGITTSQEHVRPVLGGVTATSENDQSVIENILNGILASGDYKSYRLVRIIESTKQIVAGILYRIKAEFLVDGTHKICNVKIWDKVSNQGREVQEFICESPTTSSLGGSNAAGLSTIIEKHSKPLAGGVIATSEDDKSAVLVTGGSHTGGITTSQDHSRPVLGGVTATSENDQFAIENILNGILVSGDYKSYRLVRIIESTKQIVAGILYRIKAEFLVDGTHKICNVKIWDKVSNQGREVQEFICESPTTSALGGSNAAGLSTIIEKYSKPLAGGVIATSEEDKSVILVTGGLHAGGATTSQDHSKPVLGGVTATSENDQFAIENILNGILVSGDYQSYRLVRIIESTKQIVAGILYRIKAEFLVDDIHKICNVKIWVKVSNQGREVQEFICESPTTSSLGGSNAAGLSTIIDKHSKPLAGGIIATSEDDKSAVLVTEGSHAGGITTSQEHVRPVLGGVTATSENDQSVIENILNGILASGDYKSYRLVRIIESTKQIVAGILYRIKAEFLVDGTHKICNVKIWDKVSNQGREVQEFICESHTTSALGGSNAAGLSTIIEKHSKPLAGGVIAPSEVDKRVIENILNGILTDGDFHFYKLIRIIESTKQIDAVVVYLIKAEFLINGTDHICDVKVWVTSSRLETIGHEFNCRQIDSILTGFNLVPLENKFIVQNLLSDVLTYEDYHTYKLVKIIESWEQFVNGINYKIKAEVTEKGVLKICDILILNKLTKNGKRTAEFDCKDIARQTPGGISSASEADDTKIESLLKDVLSQGDYQSYRLVRIIESTTQAVSGIVYRIRAEFDVDGLPNECNVKISDRPWLGKSGRQVEFKCDEKLRQKRQMPGEISDTLDVDRIKVESILNEVLVADDYNSYRLVRIIESSKQVVSGTLYKIKGEFSVDQSTRVCDVKIWDRPWLGNKAGRKVEFRCDSSRRKRETYGGVYPTSDIDQIKIYGLLNEVLAERDYQSYRLLKIIEISRQVVAGTLYRIKAEFDLDGAEKICDIRIWQKLMNEGNEVTHFSCVRKRAIKRRSHSSSSSSGSSSGSSESSERSNKKKIRNVLNDVLEDDDYQSYRLVRIIQGSRQKLTSGNLYYIQAIFLVDGDQKQCNVNINQRSWTDRKVYFNCEQQIRVLPQVPSSGDVIIVPISERAYIQNLVTEVLSEGDYQSYRVIRIIEASSQVSSGSIYRIKAEFTVEEAEKICIITIWVKLSNLGKEITEFTCEQPQQEQQYTTFLWRKTRQVGGTPGGITEVSESDKPFVESLLNSVLLAGEYQSYRLVRIINATKQTVSGVLYAIKAEFIIEGKTQICSLTIWDQPWMGKAGRQVEFKECAEDSSARAKRNVPSLGGSRPVEETEYPKIEEMLSTALTEGDRQNYRLTRVLHATKQLSSGWTYKIRGAFEVEGITKRCNIKIWNRPWLPNANVIESFKCDEHDEPTIRLNHEEKIKRTLDYYLHNNFTDNKIFEMYEKLYNKNYQTTLSRNMRLRIFKLNLRKIRALNQHELGTATYGVTEFADLTTTEYRMRTGLVRRTTETNHIRNPIAEIPNINLPREFDWRTRGVISQVKNQGSCGSCWAFSVIGNIEGLHAIKTGVLEEYSEQELVDCDTIDNGCNGGLPDDAYKAIEQLGGLETEKDYPYTARRDHCSFNATKVKTHVKGAVDLPKNETAIAQWLLQNGPVSIGINANAMQFYRGGVSHPWHVLCNKSDLDHGVLIVGFGVHDYPKFNKTLPYWIIKNSWGPRWGEQGYYRVYRGDNTCGVSEMVSSAVLE